MTDPNSIPPSATPSLEPEWTTVDQSCKFASVSKPTLYDWLNRGLVRNYSNRQPGQIKGKRLVSLASLRRFLDSRATGGLPE